MLTGHGAPFSYGAPRPGSADAYLDTLPTVGSEQKQGLQDLKSPFLRRASLGDLRRRWPAAPEGL